MHEYTKALPLSFSCARGLNVIFDCQDQKVYMHDIYLDSRGIMIIE